MADDAATAEEETRVTLLGFQVNSSAWCAAMRSGALPLTLYLDLLTSRDAAVLPAPHVADVWCGLLRAAEKALERAPSGHLIVQVLCTAILAAASTGTCPEFVAPDGSAGLPLLSVWAAYEHEWPRALATEIAAVEAGGEEGSGVPPRGGASPRGWTDRHLVEVMASLAGEAKKALTGLRAVVMALERKGTAWPAYVRVHDPSALLALRLSVASAGGRAARAGVREAVFREDLLAGGGGEAPVGRASSASAPASASSVGVGGLGSPTAGESVKESAASRKRRKRKAAKKAAREAAEGAAGEDEEDGEEEEDGGRAPPPPPPPPPPAPTPGDGRPPARQHALFFALLPRASASASALTPSPTGRALPLDPLFRALLGEAAVGAGGEGAAREAEGVALSALALAWAEYGRAALAAEGAGGDRLVEEGGRPLPTHLLSSSTGTISPPAAVWDGKGTIPVYAGVLQRGNGKSGAAHAPSPRAVNQACAARLAAAQALLHALGRASAGGGEGLTPPPSTPTGGEGEEGRSAWKPSLDEGGLIAAARALGAAQGVCVSGRTGAPTGLSIPEEAAVATSPAVNAPLSEEEEAWVRETGESMVPSPLPHPASASLAAAFVRVADALASALLAAGDLPAARRAHQRSYWWLTEHVLAPLHEGHDLPVLTPAHADVCATALAGWAAFESRHAEKTEVEDVPASLGVDLIQRGGQDAVFAVREQYGRAGSAAANVLLRYARRAHAGAAVVRARGEAAATAAAKEAVRLAIVARRAWEVEETARLAAEVAAAKEVGKGGKGGKGGKAAAPAKMGAPAPPPPPPPPSLAALKASTGGSGGAGGGAVTPLLDLPSALREAHAAAAAAGDLGVLASAGALPQLPSFFPPSPAPGEPFAVPRLDEGATALAFAVLSVQRRSLTENIFGLMSPRK